MSGRTGNCSKKKWEVSEVAAALTGKSPKVRAATLRTVMGRENASLIRRLGLSTSDEEEPDKILGARRKYFQPQKNVYYESFK